MCGLKKSIQTILIIKKKPLLCISILSLIIFFVSIYFKYNAAVFISEMIVITIFSAWPSYKYMVAGGITRKAAFLGNLILNIALCFLLCIIQFIMVDYQNILLLLTAAFASAFISILVEAQNKAKAALIFLLYYIIFVLLYFFPVIMFRSNEIICEIIIFLLSSLSLIWGWRVLKKQDI